MKSLLSRPNLISSLAMTNLVDSQTYIKDKWQPARPITYPTFFERIKFSYWVFIGKADCLIWPNQ